MNIIREKAKSYLGQREVSGNKGFINHDFEEKMKSVGWYFGAPWCLYFCRLVWKESGQNIKRISGSSLTTMLNATKDNNWHTEPIEGAIAIFRMFKKGHATSQGHGCIVTGVGKDIYTTIDGNTSDKNQREGVMVANRNRSLNAESWTKNDGLRLMGFIYPK